MESVGEGVGGLKEGDMVIPTFLGECRKCANCKSSRTNHCQKYPMALHGLMAPDMTSRMSARGRRLYHMFTCSTFAEYTVVNASYVVKVDPRLPPADASLLSCGFSTGYGAVWKEAKVEEGSSVAVFGLGGVGMGAIVAAKLLGASKIIGVDVNERKREKAQAFGMTDFVNPKELADVDKTVVERIRDMTGGEGVDYSFECSGAAPLIGQALEVTVQSRGVTIVAGATAAKTVEISPMHLLMGKALKGSIFGGLRPPSDVPSIVAKCVNKEIQLEEMVTHHFDLENISEAFEMLKEPECLKVVIRINDN